MNEANLPAFAALLLGVLAGPLIWWLGRKVLRFVAWQLEYGKAWLPDLAEQDLACPGCAKKFAPNESKCLECGKSREVAYYASLREVDIAEEQVVRLSQMGVVEPDTAMRMEEGLLRQKNALARLRKPQKTPNSKVEWVLPGGEPVETGYIHPETFYESCPPGTHPLRLKAVSVTKDHDLPPGRLPYLARIAGWLLLLAGLFCWLQGAFSQGSMRGQIPGLAESWIGLALMLAGFYSLAFGRASEVLGHFAAMGTGILVPAFWVIGPWIHGTTITPADWAIGLACGALCASGGAIIDRYLAQWRGDLWDETNVATEPGISEGRLMSVSGLALGLLQVGTLVGLVRPEGWFGPWTEISGSLWGIVALCGFQLGRLTLAGIRLDFRLPEWLFECGFGVVIALAANLGTTNALYGPATIAVGMALLSLLGMMAVCGPGKFWSKLLRPEGNRLAPLILRTAILTAAGGLATGSLPDPYPWAGAMAVGIGSLALFCLGTVLGQRSLLIPGLALIALAGALGCHQTMVELHHGILEQTWFALDGALLGIALGAGLARALEWTMGTKTPLHSSQILWMRLFSVQVLMASTLAAIGLALLHKNLVEIHDLASPVTMVAWILTLAMVIQVRSLRGHGLGLLAISGSILLAGILNKFSGRGILSMQAGLLLCGLFGLLLAIGVGRVRSISRRLSKVSVSWSMALLGTHVTGVLALLMGRQMGWEGLAVPAVLGGATWMLLARNRNLPGVGWVALGWLFMGILPYAIRQSTITEGLPPSLAMALIGLTLWWIIAPAKILKRNRPVGPVFAISVALLAAFTALTAQPFDLIAGGLVGFSVLALAIAVAVWQPAPMLMLVGLSGAALTTLLCKNMAAATDRYGMEWMILGLGVFVLAAAVTSRFGTILTWWKPCQNWAREAMASIVAMAAMVAFALIPNASLSETDPIYLAFLGAIPFLMAFSLSSLAKRIPNAQGKTVLSSVALCLLFVAWTYLALLAQRSEWNQPTLSLVTISFLWVVAFSILDPAGFMGHLGSQLPKGTRNILFALSGFGAVLALAGVLAIPQNGAPSGSILFAVALIIALALVGCVFYRARDMALIPLGTRPMGMKRMDTVWFNQRLQEVHGHGIWLLLALGTGLGWRLFAQSESGIYGEGAANPMVWAVGFWGICSLVIAGCRGGTHRWIARPGALQMTVASGVVAILLLGAILAQSLNANATESTSIKASSGVLATMALCAAMACGFMSVFFDRLRPKLAHVGEPGSDWGLILLCNQTLFAHSFWIASGMMLVALIQREFGIGNTYWVFLGLIPPLLGAIALRSSSPIIRFDKLQDLAPRIHEENALDEDDYEIRRVA